MVMVRITSVDTEAKLWVHEYGHNVGLFHNETDTRWIMYPIIGGSGIDDTAPDPECQKFHNPASGANATFALMRTSPGRSR